MSQTEGAASCPFGPKGVPAHLTFGSNGDGGWMTCDFCGARGPAVYRVAQEGDELPERALEAWNRCFGNTEINGG